MKAFIVDVLVLCSIGLVKSDDYYDGGLRFQYNDAELARINRQQQLPLRASNNYDENVKYSRPSYAGSRPVDRLSSNQQIVGPTNDELQLSQVPQKFKPSKNQNDRPAVPQSSGPSSTSIHFPTNVDYQNQFGASPLYDRNPTQGVPYLNREPLIDRNTLPTRPPLLSAPLSVPLQGAPPPPNRQNQQHNNQQPAYDRNGLPIQSTGYDREIPADRDRVNKKGPVVVTEFAWNLFRNLNSQRNYVISPLSPQILLSYLAWVADGPTRTELVNVNGFGSPNQIQNIVSSMLSDGTARELNMATAFFVSDDMRLNQKFFDRAVDTADVVQVDFKNPEKASSTIIRWAQMKTKSGLNLNELNLPPSTKIALASSIYFKGKFVYTFPPATPGLFFTPNGLVKADMMNMKRKFHWGRIDNFAQWVALPYESNDVLIIVLPNVDSDIDHVMRKMSSRDVEEIMRGAESESTKANVNITLPKFKLETTSNLIEPLQNMGIRDLFSSRADLRYLSDYDAVKVSNAQQQAKMEVNEEGTVFIAFTTLNVVALSFQPPIPDIDFNVNRPFIAMIVDTKANFPYIMAKVTIPSSYN